jgi:hypothetical protein
VLAKSGSERRDGGFFRRIVDADDEDTHLSRDFARDRRGSFFPAAIVGAQRAVDIVKAHVSSEEEEESSGKRKKRTGWKGYGGGVLENGSIVPGVRGLARYFFGTAISSR